jgi:hypothetical protein
VQLVRVSHKHFDLVRHINFPRGILSEILRTQLDQLRATLCNTWHTHHTINVLYERHTGLCSSNVAQVSVLHATALALLHGTKKATYLYIVLELLIRHHKLEIFCGDGFSLMRHRSSMHSVHTYAKLFYAKAKEDPARGGIAERKLQQLRFTERYTA